MKDRLVRTNQKKVNHKFKSLSIILSSLSILSSIVLTICLVNIFKSNDVLNKNIDNYSNKVNEYQENKDDGNNNIQYVKKLNYWQ